MLLNLNMKQNMEPHSPYYRREHWKQPITLTYEESGTKWQKSVVKRNIVSTWMMDQI